MNQKTTKDYYQEVNDWVLLKCKTGAVVVRPASDRIPEEEIIERFHGTRLEASDRAVILESGSFTQSSLFDFGL